MTEKNVCVEFYEQRGGTAYMYQADSYKFDSVHDFVHFFDGEDLVASHRIADVKRIYVN